MNSKFAPSPLHGAAYAIAIETVGGTFAIGSCNTQERYAVLRDKLDGLRKWSVGQPAMIYQAYAWGISKVDDDIKGRLAVHENSRKVKDALASIPRPDKT